jgi:hypothetical protein
MHEECPLLFGDFIPYDVDDDGVGHWRPEYEKV